MRNPLTGLLVDRVPPGFQFEARHSDNQLWTDYRYTRLTDGLWCQQSISDCVVDYARDLRGLADIITEQVIEKFRSADNALSAG